MVISTPPLFGVTFPLSRLLCAVCDIGFGDNKWLDVFRCHVKPGQGHARHYNCWGVSGSKVWVFGAGSLRLLQIGRCARLGSLSAEEKLHLKHFFPPFSKLLVQCPELGFYILRG